MLIIPDHRLFNLFLPVLFSPSRRRMPVTRYLLILLVRPSLVFVLPFHRFVHFCTQGCEFLRFGFPGLRRGELGLELLEDVIVVGDSVGMEVEGAHG